MSPVHVALKRFIGLDIHKHYLVAVGVDAQQQVVFGPQRVTYTHLTPWVQQHLRTTDVVVLEMTTNAFQIHDELLPYVQSVLVVHPQHVALVTQVPVKTDTKAALTLAQLLAAGLLKGVWVPPPAVRDLRTLVIQRQKLRRLATQARNRLHAALHRARIVPPAGNLFAPTQHAWWHQLPVSALEHARIQSDLATFTFAEAQVAQLEDALAAAAATDARVPLLIQLPGIQLVSAVTILAAIGDITRFPSAQQLVGYAGLGARVHDSGQLRRTGRITKTGRRDLRHIMVEAAHSASRHHGHWRAEFRALAFSLRPQQSAGGHCTQAVGRRVACADQGHGGSPCGALPSRTVVHGVWVPLRARASPRWTIGAAIGTGAT